MNTTQAIIKFGSQVCIDAYKLHKDGNGAKTIGSMFKLTTAQADNAINAGRELVECEQTLIEYVRLHANARYNQGWGWVVECFDDGDILEYLSDAQMDLPKALQAIQNDVDQHASFCNTCQF